MIDLDAIPDELQDRDQWLMWDSSADTPRRPHWAGNFSISWSDPDDWHSFEEAVEAARTTESWGIVDSGLLAVEIVLDSLKLGFNLIEALERSAVG
jgi:hypothetical protein